MISPRLTHAMTLNPMNWFNFLASNHTKFFVAYVRYLTVDGGMFLPIYDGYPAHLSPKVLTLFRENTLIAYGLPFHTSGKL